MLSARAGRDHLVGGGRKRSGLRCALAEPLGPWGERKHVGFARGLPRIGATRDVPGWRRDDVAAITTGIESSGHAAGGVADLVAGMGEEEVATAAAGERLDGVGLPVLGLELGQAVVAAMAGVNVEHHKAGLGACGDRNMGVGPRCPPVADLLGVGGGVLAAVGGARMLAGGRWDGGASHVDGVGAGAAAAANRVAGKHAPATSGVGERGVEEWVVRHRRSPCRRG